MTWILIIVLAGNGFVGTTIYTVPGFKSEAACQDAGEKINAGRRICVDQAK